MLTGFHYVRRDMREPGYNRPGYVRSAGHRWLTRFLWLPISLMHFTSVFSRGGRGYAGNYLRTEALPSYLRFAIYGVIGTLAFSYLI